MATTITIFNRKGGVAKTTTTIALAAGLIQNGKRILLVDVDGQPGNLSLAVGADKTNLCGTYELFTDNAPTPAIEDYIQATELSDIIAAGDTLPLAENELTSALAREHRLAKALTLNQDTYDYILIDTPPALNIFTINALVAANEVIIPTGADMDATVGTVELLKNIAEIKEAVNPGLEIKGILITNFRPQTNLQKEIETALYQIAGSRSVPVFQTKIKQSVAIQEARRHGVNPISYDSSSPGAQCYKAFVEEYLKG